MSTFKRLMGYLGAHWRVALVAVSCTFIGSGLGLVSPWLTKMIIDQVLIQGQYEMLGVLVLGIVGLSALRGLFSFLERYAGGYTGQRVLYDLRKELYEHLQDLSYSFYDQTETGQIISRATTDAEQVRRFLSFGFFRLLSSAATFGVALYILLSINWTLTLLSLGVLPTVFLLINRYRKKVRPLYSVMREEFGQITSILQENIVGVKVVKAFVGEEKAMEEFGSKNREYFNTSMLTARVRAFTWPTMRFIVSLGVTFIFWYGGRGVIQGELSLGSLVAFSQYLNMLTWPVIFMGFVTDFSQRALAAAERIFEVIDAEPEVQEKPDAIILPPIKGYVKFENVSFGYDGERRVLNNISLEVKPNEKVALLGVTGSGKSSIVVLIPRFYDVKEGRITVDGYDIRDITLSSLRKQMGMVHQETFLFAATIKENIAYGKPDASMEDIDKAAKAAKIYEFIQTLPEGYDTLVGERGITLSGGQKQRVAIARALLVDPRILILDDSTSNVDVETEHLIQESLSELLRNRTTFIITQRLSTVRRADRIIFLQDGEIVEEGTHEELMRKMGAYAELYNAQFKPQETVIVEQVERQG